MENFSNITSTPVSESVLSFLMFLLEHVLMGVLCFICRSYGHSQKESRNWSHGRKRNVCLKVCEEQEPKSNTTEIFFG